MIRAEIICNQSVQDDVVELLEQEIPDFEFTLVPAVQGKGLKSKKLGDTVWPEMNFILIAYVSEENAKKVKSVVAALKEKFPREGISIFFTAVVEV